LRPLQHKIEESTRSKISFEKDSSARFHGTNRSTFRNRCYCFTEIFLLHTLRKGVRQLQKVVHAWKNTSLGSGWGGGFETVNFNEKIQVSRVSGHVW
jgi:hypothetical protein